MELDLAEDREAWAALTPVGRTLVQRERFYGELTRFLTEGNSGLSPDRIGPAENLIDLGVINSLRMVELILFIEELLGIEIPIEHFEPRTFHSIDRIYEAFAAPLAEGARP